MISIIVPVYNVEKYLSKCIESCLSQTYSNIEIIAVNDGSTDSSADILEYYRNKDTRIKIIHKVNEGVAKTRIVGINHAKGDFLYFLDSDDTIPYRCLELLRDEIDKAEVDIVIGDYAECYENGVYKNFKFPYNENIITPEKFIDLLLSDKIPGSIWGKLYRKRLACNAIPTAYKLGEDATLLVQFILKANKISYIEESVYNYLQRIDSAVHVKKPNYLTDMYFHRLWIVDYLKDMDAKYNSYPLVDYFIARGYIRCVFWGGYDLLPNNVNVATQYKNTEFMIPLWEKIVYKTIPFRPINSILIYFLHYVRKIKLALS